MRPRMSSGGLHLTGAFPPGAPSLPWADSAGQRPAALPAVPARQAGDPATLCECTRSWVICAQRAPSLNYTAHSSAYRSRACPEADTEYRQVDAYADLTMLATPRWHGSRGKASCNQSCCCWATMCRRAMRASAAAASSSVLHLRPPPRAHGRCHGRAARAHALLA